MLVFHHLKGRGHKINAQAIVEGEPGSPSTILRTIFTGILEKYLVGDRVDMSGQIARNLTGSAFRTAKEAVLEVTRDSPVIIAVDSMEHSSIDDQYVMWATAALVECASDMNAQYASKGFHIKVFLTDEIFPYFQENVVTNVSKHIRHPLFLHWRPRDLARLVCWRFHKYLTQSSEYDVPVDGDIDWSRYQDVVDTVWSPFFDDRLQDEDGLTERTFPYMLRHTQMRPRQLMMICNRIARMARDAASTCSLLVAWLEHRRRLQEQRVPLVRALTELRGSSLKRELQRAEGR